MCQARSEEQADWRPRVATPGLTRELEFLRGYLAARELDCSRVTELVARELERGDHVDALGFGERTERDVKRRV